MADITRDTFSKDKNRYKVVFQKGKPVLDAELNEAQDIVKNRVEEVFAILKNGFSSTGFKIIQGSTSTTNNFAISAGTLYDAMSRYNSTNVDYINQYNTFSFQTISPITLATPVADRTDLVYLETWPGEILSSTDSSMLDSNLLIETAVRKIVKFAIKVATGTTVLPSPTEDATNGKCYTLAYLNRLAGNGSILTAMIEDKRCIVGDFQELVYNKRAIPFTLNSTAINVINDIPAYGIQMISLSGAGGHTNYFVSRIQRDDVGYNWKFFINDGTQDVCGLTAVGAGQNPTGFSHIVLAEMNDSQVIGFVVIDWSAMEDAIDETFTSTELVIRDEYCNRDYSTIGQSISKTSLYRGAYAPVYPVLGDDTYTKGMVFKRNEGITTVDGNTQSMGSQEQYYPVSRKDQTISDVTGDPYSLQTSVLETPAIHKIDFTPTSGLYNSEYHNRIGFYTKSVGTIGAGIPIIYLVIHDAGDNLIGDVIEIDADDFVVAGVDNWIYANHPITLTPGSPYHYHIYTALGWTAQPTIATESTGADVSYSQFYKPAAGKARGSIYADDVVKVLNSAGSEVVTENLFDADIMADIEDGFKRQSTGTNYDYIAVDFSNDTDWTNWIGYQDFIGIDLITGRIKLPSGLALNANDLFLEFNTKNFISEIDTKTVFIHETGQALEDFVTDRFISNVFSFTSASDAAPVVYSAGSVTVTHRLNKKYVNVKVIDDIDKEIIPDDVTFTNTTTLLVDLSTFHSITGTWQIIISP